MSDSKALINFGDVSKPVTVLIEKISNAVGVLYEPTHIRKVAQANADAAMIEAKGQIEITDLTRRAMQRFITEEAKKQQNIEDITRLALPDVKDDAKSEQVSEDWISDFFDKCRLISDKEMQQLWAKVLAGEANSPGKFSKRSISLLASLDKSDAELLTIVASFCWSFGDETELAPVIFHPEFTPYKNAGLSAMTINHLNDIGLIRFESNAVFHIKKLGQLVKGYYFGDVVDIRLPKDSDNTLAVGSVVFSKAGKELLALCNRKPQGGFVKFVCNYWNNSGAAIVATPVNVVAP